MFLELPRELQEAVYDKLSVRDRINLNLALPKAHTIKKTIRTDAAKDKRLGIAWYYVTKKKPAHLPRYMQYWMERHSDDPTIQGIIEDIKKKLLETQDMSQKELAQHAAAMLELENDIRNDSVDVSRAQLYPIREVLSYQDNQQLLGLLAAHGTPRVLDKMIEIPVTQSILADLFSGKDVLFTFVNSMRSNDDALKHILANKEKFGIRDEHIEYITQPHLVKIFISFTSVKAIMENFIIPMDVKKQCLEKYIENCLFDCADYMMKEWGVRL